MQSKYTSVNIKTGGVRKLSAEQFEFWFRLIWGVGKYGEQWFIIHERESVPFYMDEAALW
jgi:hypothetical protein